MATCRRICRINSRTRQKFAIFGEFEYSPKWSFLKIGRTRYIRRHSPTCFGRTRYIRPTFANHFPRTRYIRSHSPKAIFEKNVTRLDTFARVIRHFGEFGASGHCLVLMHSCDQVSLNLEMKQPHVN